MKIKDLEYFNCLCEEKSFTSTAKKLYISQPSITLSINRLEKELGTVLVIRNHSNKELKITESGEILRKHIKNIFSELEEAKLEIEKIKSKKIRVGIPPIIGAYFFPQFIEKLNSEGLIEDIEFIQTGSIKMKQLLLEGKVDIALLGSLEFKEENEELESCLLEEDNFVMCISKKNRIIEELDLRFPKLKNEKFIVLGDEYLHSNVLERLFELHGIESKKVYHTGEIQTAKSLIAADLGVGIMVKMSVDDMEEIITAPLKNEIKFYILISVKKGHYLTEKEREIINIIKKKNNEDISK